MKFDNSKNHIEHCIIKADKSEPCAVCGEPTKFIDYCFETRLCSEECQKELTDLCFR